MLNNLRAFGVGRLSRISVIGDDGAGYDSLRNCEVETAGGLVRPDRMTPTSTKPMLLQPGEASRELNRLNIKN